MTVAVVERLNSSNPTEIAYAASSAEVKGCKGRAYRVI
jgi:hypothetical protein